MLKEVKALANSSNNVEETSNTFCYNLGYLTRVKHDSCTYDFTYDGFGRITAVSVGGRIIIRTAYIESGTDIDGVEGATSKTVTGYYNDNAKTGVLCGEVLCGQATVGSSGKKSGAAYLGNLFCGQYFLAADNMTGQSNDNWQNNVYASYYNCYGELIKVRHAINRELTDVFDSDADYVSVTDECEYAGNTRILTYVVGTAKYVYNYDRTTGDLLDSTEYENDVLKLKHETVSYDKFGRTNKVQFTLDNGSTMVYNYTYKSDYEDGVASVKLPNNITCSIDTDTFGRLTARTLNTSTVLKNEYVYKSSKTNSAYTTPLVESEKLIAGSVSATYKYTYDSNNNILTVRNASNALISSYQYDGLNRLIRENIVGGNTTVYKYDKGGNLQFKKVFAYSAASGSTVTELLNSSAGTTVNYGYSGDLLTSYNGSGTLEYDNYGNPKSGSSTERIVHS